MQKSCKQCDSSFEIREKDLQFYDKVSTVVNGQKYSLPSPEFCRDCRKQRRLAFRNERFLYKRSCDLCHKEIVSVFTKDASSIVYCYDCYYSDKWDPVSYGREYDFSRSFFEQFNELEKSLPHFALFQDATSENCEYVNYGSFNKSCYLMLGGHCEEVYYSHIAIKSKSSMDCKKIVSCEFCYECVDCNNCYNLFFSQDCGDCSDSFFLNDCRQCSNCFASTGLRNKKFVFQNLQLTEEEYKKRLQDVKFTNETIGTWKRIHAQIFLKIPKKYMHGVNNENVTGDYIDNCKNIDDCFDCLDAQDCTYCDAVGIQSKDMYDCSIAGIGTELCYEITGAEKFNRCKFIYYGRVLGDCEYCKYCDASNNLFGCISLRRKKYCILNRQYTKEEYKKSVSKIIEQMIQDKEYGEYFAAKDSLFAYNESVAHEYYPLTKELALVRGYRWKDDEVKQAIKQTCQVPNEIDKVPDSITQEILSCAECGRNFKIIRNELGFYRKWNLPVPEKCPECRHKNRFQQRNPQYLWNRNCMKCAKNIQTSYSPDRSEIIYCEECYLKEIY